MVVAMSHRRYVFTIAAGLVTLMTGSRGTPALAQSNPADTAPAVTSPAPLRYFLEKVEIRGNDTTRAAAIRNYVPIKSGDLLDVAAPSVEAIRWRLMGTGWFSGVKLSLERGSRRGWVILVIEVRERNTVVVTGVVAGVAKAVRRSSSTSTDLIPYGGMGIAENNLLGLGIGLSAAGVYSAPQQGLELRFSDPMFLKSEFSLNGRLFFNNARDFFGRVEKTKVSISCPEPTGDTPEECDPDVQAKTAVVIYKRVGLGIGTGRDLSASVRYTLDWQGELVHVTSMPQAASTQRGSEVVPIDFSIDDDWSTVSSVHFGLVFDRRNDPSLPSRGALVTFDSRIGSGIIGSRYDFARLESTARQWFRLPWGHVLSPGVFAGMVFGYSPFFYRFYASDLSDLIPSRVLELNLDHRGPHNLLGTSIKEMRMADLAAKLDLEYSLTAYKGGGGIQQIQAYARAGIYALSNIRDVRVAIQGYHGWTLLPVDLTFDLGIRMDTSVGLFQLGFSTLMGFLPEL
jgi:outer membrane protein insertion porin family